jgi:hypothetical protein
MHASPSELLIYRIIYRSPLVYAAMISAERFKTSVTKDVGRDEDYSGNIEAPHKELAALIRIADELIRDGG